MWRQRIRRFIIRCNLYGDIPKLNQPHLKMEIWCPEPSCSGAGVTTRQCTPHRAPGTSSGDSSWLLHFFYMSFTSSICSTGFGGKRRKAIRHWHRLMIPFRVARLCLHGWELHILRMEGCYMEGKRRYQEKNRKEKAQEKYSQPFFSQARRVYLFFSELQEKWQKRLI